MLRPLHILPLLYVTLALAAPGRADTPPASAPVAVHKLFLHHASPEQVMQALHWDNSAIRPNNSVPSVPFAMLSPKQQEAEFSHSLGLPTGVDHVYAIDGDSSLLVFATAAGFARVQALVQPLDDAPQVQIKTDFVDVATADVDALDIALTPLPTADLVPASFTSGAGATRFIALLNKVTKRSDTAAVRTSFDDTPVFVDREEVFPYLLQDLDTHPNSQFAFETVTRFVTIWPHINGAASVTLAVDVPLDDGEPFVAPPTDKTVGQVQPPFFAAPLILQTVPSGDTLALRFTLPNKTSAKPSRDLIVLITPTVLNSGDDAGKPPPATVPPAGH